MTVLDKDSPAWCPLLTMTSQNHLAAKLTTPAQRVKTASWQRAARNFGGLLWRISKILYAGHEILLPDSLDVDEFASTLQEAYFKGGHLWATLDSRGRGLPQVRLFLAQIIPVCFVMDEADGGDGATTPGLAVRGSFWVWGSLVDHHYSCEAEGSIRKNRPDLQSRGRR